MRNLTGDTLLKLFNEVAEKKNKIVIPKESDGYVCASIIRFVSSAGGSDEAIKECLKIYIRSSKHTISINDFAIKFSDVYDGVVSSLREREEFKKTLAETKRRMEELH